MIIAVIGEKGGTGKTTFAVNLAGMRACENFYVLLVDTDRQGSATYWRDARLTHEGLPTPDCEAHYGEIESVVEKATQRYDDIILDVGVGDSNEMQAALAVADVAVTTIKPAGVDIWTMGIMEENVARAKDSNPDLVCYATLNMASTNPKNKDTEKALVTLSQLEFIDAAPFVVHSRVAHERATPKGLTTSEMGTWANKAAEEIRQVYDLIFSEERR